MGLRIRGAYGRPLERRVGFALSREALEKIAQCLIDAIIEEGQKDFAKRGWPLNDPKGGPPFQKSFSFRIAGNSTIEIQSSFYGLKTLIDGDVPGRRMVWLTQEHKENFPTAHELTPSEKRLGMKKAGRISKGERKPLVVPLRADDGTVVFRMAPLKMNDAWIHPGIAKFTFVERAMRKGKDRCAEILKQEVARYLGNP